MTRKAIAPDTTSIEEIDARPIERWRHVTLVVSVGLALLLVMFLILRFLENSSG